MFLLACILAVYLPTLSYEFLNWDDGWYVVNNELITSWSPANLYRIATEVVARNYAPATIFALLVQHTLFDDWAGGYHFVNVLMHSLNAVLVYQLLRRLTKDEWLSWLVAGLFALHPVQVESVAWVSNCKTLLSSTGMLASLLCWMHPQRTHRQELWGMLWLALALLSRPSAVTLPGVVLVYDWLVIRKPFREALGRQLLPLLACCLLLLATMFAQTAYWGGVRHHLSLNKFQLLAVDTTILMRYAGMLLWPRGLSVLYDPPFENIEWQIFLATLCWGLIGWKLWSVRHTHPLATLAGASWIAMFLPVINLFPLTSLMNDRYLYLTCVPFFAVVLSVGRTWARKLAHTLKPAFGPGEQTDRKESLISGSLGAVCSVAILAAATWGTLNYLPVWRNPVSLWSNARLRTPSLALVQIQWALTMRQEGRNHEAVAALRHALEHCQPDEGDRERIHRMLRELQPDVAMETGIVAGSRAGL